jgi:Uma2 family endonuclease
MTSAQALTLKTRRWTRVEYERLVECGVLQEDERVELLDGLLVVREPQGSRHNTSIRCVVAALRTALGDAWQIDSQLAIALDDDSEPEPDIAVVPGDARSYRDAHPSRPVLIVEVAETSYRIDRTYKAGLYARAGVPEYWIVDVARSVLEVHRQPEAASEAVHGWRYAIVEMLRPPATVTPLIAPDVTIRVADLLP